MCCYSRHSIIECLSPVKGIKKYIYTVVSVFNIKSCARFFVILRNIIQGIGLNLLLKPLTSTQTIDMPVTQQYPFAITKLMEISLFFYMQNFICRFSVKELAHICQKLITVLRKNDDFLPPGCSDSFKGHRGRSFHELHWSTT